VESETYNKLFTMHGVVMIFFFLIPSIPAVLGNFLVPIMIGAKDLAFPRLNLLSWYIYMIGGTVHARSPSCSAASTRAGPSTRPTAPLREHQRDPGPGLGVFITGFSSILTGLNFIVTIHKMRAPGMTWFRLPLFVWAHYATSLIMVAGHPGGRHHARAVALERGFGIGIFDPPGRRPGALPAPVLVLLAPGRVHHDPARHGRDQRGDRLLRAQAVFGYKFVAFSSLAIAVLGFFVWGHHMYVTASRSTRAGLLVPDHAGGHPLRHQGLQLDATLYKGSVSWSTPMLYALGFIGLFTIGGLTGVFLGTIGLDVHVHDTYFVVAHFHYVMVGGTVMAYMGGLHFWWPKMTGRMYSEGWAKFAALLVFVGFNLTFFPQFLLGYMGMPRRYHMPTRKSSRCSTCCRRPVPRSGTSFRASTSCRRSCAASRHRPTPGARPASSGRSRRRRRSRTSSRRRL
jgi:cytochrome c oxidase subunit 1